MERVADQRTILVVDDEPIVREVVSTYLEREGFVVEEADDGREALEMLERLDPDLVVLDVMLPYVDGFSILTALRRTSDVPVILLTARSEEPDRILGLELGADDYVVKPFSPREVAARVRTVLRRSSERPPPVEEERRMDFGDLVVDPRTREVLVAGEPVDLTPKEFDLLAFLASSPRQVFSRGQLLEHVWASSVEWQDPSTVTVHVRRIRQKIEPDPDEPRWVTTVWGVGYRFEP
ncbi:MAG TPA: response regulator transcription factor [Actinobacteria bacterium]|nr:response regulator transcription factor [Actinomycetota bacterium]